MCHKAVTVLQAFEGGVADFGLPCKVCTDHGGQNIKVWEYMLLTHNNDETMVVTGSSTHNERIERLWRDIHRSVGSIYASTFRSLKQEEIFNIEFPE